MLEMFIVGLGMFVFGRAYEKRKLSTALGQDNRGVIELKDGDIITVPLGTSVFLKPDLANVFVSMPSSSDENTLASKQVAGYPLPVFDAKRMGAATISAVRANGSKAVATVTVI